MERNPRVSATLIPVRAWLLRASWWQLGLVHGGLFGTFMVLYTRYWQDSPWVVAVPAGTLGGLVFGVLMGRVSARMNKRAREAADTDDPALMRRAAVAASRGPVPQDPETRERARGLALLQREQLLRQRPWAIPFFLLMIASDVWFALTRSPWWLIAGVIFAAMLVMHLVMPRRLERRAELLADPAAGEH